MEIRANLIPLTRTLIKRGGQAFSTVLGTLDALHLSSADLLFQDNPNISKILLTHDIQLGRAARSMGIEVIGL